MEHQTQTYFEENEAEDVAGFTIIDVSGEREEYHIAEKWSRTSDEEGSSPPENDKWLQYWIPEAQLLSRIDSGKCEKKAMLTEEQYEKVCQMIDHDEVVATPA